jgi:hypothetical protein
MEEILMIEEDKKTEKLKRIANQLKKIVAGIHQDLNEMEIDENKEYYVYHYGLVFEDEETAKEELADIYRGLDDGLTDWIPDVEEITGKELKERLKIEKMSLEW